MSATSVSAEVPALRPISKAEAVAHGGARNASRAQPPSSTDTSSRLWAIAALLPALSAVRLGTSLTAWDIVAAAILPATLGCLPGGRLRRIFPLTGVLTVASLLTTNYLRALPLRPTLPAIEPVLAASLTFFFVLRLRQRRDNLERVALASLALGLIIGESLSGAPGGLHAFWKYGASTWTTVLVLLFLTHRRRSAPWLFAVPILAAINLSSGSRSGLLALVVSLGIIFLSSVRARGRLPMRAMALMTILLGAFIWLVVAPATDRYSADYTGAKAQYQSRVNTNAILAGRVEPPVSIAAVMHSPIFGLGYPPIATRGILDDAMTVARNLGYEVDPGMVSWWTTGDEVNTHSVLFQYWVASGLIGLAFPAAVLGLCISGLWRGIRRADAMGYVTLFLAVSSAWDVLFSPPTYGVAMEFAFACALMVGQEIPTISDDASSQREFPGAPANTPGPVNMPRRRTAILGR